MLSEYETGAEEISVIEMQARAAGISVHGAVSIHVYGLNRLALVQERTRLLWRLEFLASVVVDVSKVADSLEGIAVPGVGDRSIRDAAVVRLREMAGNALAEMRATAQPDAPFSAIAKAWIVDFLKEIP